MRWTISLAALVLASATLATAGEPSAAPVSGLPGVVYLNRSARFSVPSAPNPSLRYEGPLLREIQRQAFLLAARDQLGLSTRDAWLGDAMPTEGENEPFEVNTGDDATLSLELRRGFRPASKTILQVAPESRRSAKSEFVEFTLPDSVDHRVWLVEAETLSRGRYVEALRQCGFRGKANAVKSDAAVPEEIETQLEAMTFTSQFAAVRRLHLLLRGDGESAARLGALARGYANLGLLTEFHWHPAHKVFKARALLYAQRMAAADAKSPSAMWHRAYAFAATGLHALALDDLKAADALCKEIKKENRPKRPDWVDLIDAHCRFDLDRLKLAGASDRHAALHNFLRYLTIELSGDENMTITTAFEVLPTMPECYRIHDGLCRFAGVIASHRGTTEWLPIAGRRLYPAVAAMPDLPSAVEKIARDFEPPSSEQAMGDEAIVRGKLIRALADTQGESSDPKRRGTPADQGEPSWNALGKLIGELSFVQTYRRLNFEANYLGVPADQTLKTLSPMTVDHPYAPFIESFASDEKTKRAAWKRLRIPADAIEAQESTMCWERDLRYGWHTHAMLSRILCTQDRTIRDMSVLSTMSDDNANNTARAMLAVSPFSPQAKAIAVNEGRSDFRGQFAAWEKTAERHPALCKALAHRYVADERLDDAIRWAKAAIASSPELKTYRLLADIYWKQGHADQWVSTLEESLDQPDYGLEHGRVCDLIARYYMVRKNWKKAVGFAEGAAETYSCWGLFSAADCYEGMHRWNESEKLRKAAAERYDQPNHTLGWYLFCRRTGHGNVEAARTAYRAVYTTKGGVRGDPVGVAVFFLLEKKPKEALQVVSDAIRHGEKNAFFLLCAASLNDELKNAEARDVALAQMIARGAQVRASNDAASEAVLVELAKWMATDLAAGGKGDTPLDAIDKINDERKAVLGKAPYSNDSNTIVFDCFLGRYLALHGKTDEAIRHWKKAVADTSLMRSATRSIAGAELCARDITPESYESLWQPSEPPKKAK